MKPYATITLNTGHVYQIPTSVFVEHRAAEMLKLHPGTFQDLAAAKRDSELALDDIIEFNFWLRNHMEPSDYIPHARLVRFAPPVQDFDEAKWRFDDHPAMMGELDGDSLMRSSLEAVICTMASSKQLVNMTLLNNEHGQPFGAVVMIIGGAPIIGAFTETLKFTANQLVESGAVTINPSH